MSRFDTITKLRFPVLFGSILGTFYLGFKYRQNFMEDLDIKRQELNKEDLESKRIIEAKIREAAKALLK